MFGGPKNGYFLHEKVAAEDTISAVICPNVIDDIGTRLGVVIKCPFLGGPFNSLMNLIHIVQYSSLEFYISDFKLRFLVI